MKVRDLRDWLTSSAATSKWLVLFFMANTLYASYALGNFSLTGTSQYMHLVDILSAALGAVTLLLGGLWLRSRKAQIRIWPTITIWVLASLVACWAQIGLTALLTPGADLGPLIASWAISVFQVVMVFFFYTGIVHTWVQGRKASVELAGQRLQLEKSQANFEQQKSEIEDRLRNLVKDKLGKALAIIKTNLEQSASANPKELAKLVLSGLNQGVRPLSWEIENHSTGFTHRHHVPAGKISPRDRFATPLSMAGGFAVPLFAVGYFSFEPFTAFYVLGFTGVTEALITGIVLAVVLSGIQKFWGAIKLPPLMLVALYTLVAYVAGASIVGLRTLAGQTADLDLAWAFPGTTAIIALFTSLTSISVSQRLRDNAHQAEVNQELELLVARVRQSAWLAKQRFARLVHGPVQSLLLVTYLKLNEAESLSATELQQVASDIEKASELLDLGDGTQNLNLVDMVEVLTSQWGADRAFDTRISPEVSHAPVTRESLACLYEVLREGVNNAVKHGSAGLYQVRISLAGPGLVRVEIDNPMADSEPGQSGENPGFGTSILDEVTFSHSLVTSGGRASFTALVPCNLE